MKTLLVMFVMTALGACMTPEQRSQDDLRSKIEVKWPDPSRPFPEQPQVAAAVLAEISGKSLLEWPVFVRAPVYHDTATIETWLGMELSGEGWPEAMRRVDIINHLPALSGAPSEIEGALGTALRARLEELFLERKHTVVIQSCHECLVVEPHVALFRLPADRRAAFYGFVSVVTYKGHPVAKSRQYATLGRVPDSPHFSEKRPMFFVGRVLEYETRAVLEHVFGEATPVGASSYTMEKEEVR